ncbi:MAG: hypothetical protein IIY09_00075 [Clostridia bacterium]|nr:hypothetical protein [Clostridia bacterium]
MLKKLFALILSFLALFCLWGCGKNNAYSSRVSENLNRLYAGENDGYVLSAAAGLREQPYLADGVVGTVIPFFRIKVVPRGEWSEGEEFSLSLLVGEESYGEKLTVSPLGDYLSATIAAECPEGKEVTAVIYRDGQSQRIPLILAQTVSFDSALRTAVKALSVQLSGYVVRGKFQGEIHARLTKVGETIYWFFSFIPPEKDPLSALIDAKDGKLLAVKDANGILSPSAAPTEKNKL